jgi:AAA domain
VTDVARRRAPSRAARSLTVELAGLPGSGKSRLARMLVRGLGERGIPVSQPQAPMGVSVPTARRLARKAAACATTAVSAPRHTTRLAQGVLASGQPSRPDAAARLVQLLVALNVAALPGGTPGVSIVDEGLVQALWSIGLRGDVSGVLGAFDFWQRELADVLVVLRVPLDVAQARLNARTSQHSRTQLLPESARLAELERGAVLLDELVEWWAGRPPAGRQVCVLSRSEEESDERAQLLDRISALAEKAPS